MNRHRLLLTSLLTLLFANVFIPLAFAQEDDEVARPVTEILSLRLGNGKVRNTYLTPLLYSGANLSLEWQRWRLQRNENWVNWQLADLSFASTSDLGDHGDTWAGRLRYRYGVLHKWNRQPSWLNGRNLSLFVGPYLGGDLGFDYNLKMASGNNPATARIAANAGVMMAASVDFHPQGLRLPVMLQARTPLLGLAFMPEYGASYYETFYLGTSENNCHFTSVHNQQDADIQLSADLPLALIPGLRQFDSVIRFGLDYHIETMDINDITTRFSSFSFVVGWVFEQVPYSRRKSNLLKRQPHEAY